MQPGWMMPRLVRVFTKGLYNNVGFVMIGLVCSLFLMELEKKTASCMTMSGIKMLFFNQFLFEPCRVKTGLQGFRSSLTQNKLYKHRR